MNPIVAMATSTGILKIELFEDKSPISVRNFLGYVEDGFYDNTLFHRVIPNFVIQGGGYEPGMKQKKTKAPIKNESGNGLLNRRGTLANARTTAPDSATAQFFINVVDNEFLDRSQAQDGIGYCVFGQVIDGLDVADRITTIRTVSKHGHGNVPEEDVLIHFVLNLRQIEQQHLGDASIPGLMAALYQPGCDALQWGVLADRLEEMGSRFAPQVRRVAART